MDLEPSHCHSDELFGIVTLSQAKELMRSFTSFRMTLLCQILRGVYPERSEWTQDDKGRRAQKEIERMGSE
jgi:hypothetical protein